MQEGRGVMDGGFRVVYGSATFSEGVMEGWKVEIQGVGVKGGGWRGGKGVGQSGTMLKAAQEGRRQISYVIFHQLFL